MAAYNDFFIRDNFGDSGAGPSRGVLSLSPDIIPRGANNPSLDWTGDIIGKYSGPDLGLQFSGTGPNYIYVRIIDLQGSGTESGEVSLYWAYPSVFLTPDVWTKNVIYLPDGQTKVAPVVNKTGSKNLSPNDIGIGNPLFLLQGLPPNMPGHVCLIAVVNTPNTPVTIPTSFSSNADFALWVQQQRNVGWRNVDIVPSTQQRIVSTYSFGNKLGSPADFHVRVQATGYPANTPVTVQCADQKYPFNWSGSFPAPDPSGKQTTGFDLTSVPGSFRATFVVTASPSTTPSGPTRLWLSYYQYPHEQDDREILRAVARNVDVVRAEPGKALQADNPMLIQLGECTITTAAGALR